MNVRTSLLGAALALISINAARADPRLDEVVYSPYVEKGMAELETRYAVENGGALSGQSTSVIEAEYGVSDRVSLSLVSKIERAYGEGTNLTGLGLESIIYVARIPGVGVDTGLYLEYTHGLHGDTDTAEGKLLLAKTQGRFQGLLNLIVEEPLNAPRGEGYAAYGYAASATWNVVGNLRVGAEAFGDFGNDHAFLGAQGAYVGPQIKWEGRPKFSPVEISLDAGWLAAVGTDRSEASSQVRVAFEFEHRF